MKTPSLHNQVRNGSLLILALAAGLSAITLLEVYRLGEQGHRLAFQLALALAIFLAVGYLLSWSLGRRVSRSLVEMADRLRTHGSRRLPIKLADQDSRELQSVANEFNKLSARLEEFEKIKVDRLIYEKRKVESIIDNIEDGIILIDPNGITTHINELAAIIIGVDRHDALGCRFDDLDSGHPHYLQVRNALRHVGEENGRIELNLHVRGREHNYLLKPVHLREDGDFFGTILILQDVTYFRDQERIRANLVETLSHELRTPLTAMNLATEMIRRQCPNLDPKEKELVGVVTEEACRIGELADDLLDLASSDIGTITVGNVDLDLARLVKGVAQKFEQQAKEKSIQLRVHVQSAALGGRGDPIKLSWVVSNLIGNALRYTPAGGTIDVSAEKSGAELKLIVADSGAGISPEVRDRIFEHRSWNGSEGTDPELPSLGLAIVKEIVEAHDGRIFLETGPTGSRFTVRLPITEHSDVAIAGS